MIIILMYFMHRIRLFEKIKLKLKIMYFTIGGNTSLKFIGGPCAIESLDHSLFMAESISYAVNYG